MSPRVGVQFVMKENQLEEAGMRKVPADAEG